MSDSKKCTKCGIEKSLEEFSKDKSSNDGYKCKCKECDKKYQEENKENIKEQKKKYYLENKESIDANNKKYREENKESRKEYDKKYYEENKEEINEQKNKYRKENIEKTRQRTRDRRNTDPLFKLVENLRSRMKKAIKEGQGFKLGNSEELLGCSFEEVRDHLHSNFKEGMTWENHGIEGWHIDHIKPCATFDLTDSIQQRVCFHYTNLQPMWATENISKSDKWDINLQENIVHQEKLDILQQYFVSLINTVE
jgi:hypothetical protein